MKPAKTVFAFVITNFTASLATKALKVRIKIGLPGETDYNHDSYVFSSFIKEQILLTISMHFLNKQNFFQLWPNKLCVGYLNLFYI